MKKIPTLFRRDPDDMRRVLTEVTPGCEWVLAGEGVATRKYDGTCMALDTDGWWARREVKADKPFPTGFHALHLDPITGKTVGWEPADQSSYFRWFKQAFESDPRHDGIRGGFQHGTYELCGPKVNGNPEGFAEHVLVAHADAELVRPFNLTFDGLRDTVRLLAAENGYEGLVWHHPDGRMAKLKAKDFR